MGIYTFPRRGKGPRGIIRLVDTPEAGVFAGARVSLTAGETIAGGGTLVAVPWDQADFDTSSFWSSGSPTRLTVPTGFDGYVRLSGNADWDTNTAGQRDMLIDMNGSGSAILWVKSATSGSGTTAQNGTTGPLAVSAGDYFQMKLAQNSGGNRTLDATTASWFAIEFLGV